MVANAGFVDSLTDPNPKRWNRDEWYRAFPSPPTADYLEVVAAIAPRPALLISYVSDDILVSVRPSEARLSDFVERFPSVTWEFRLGEHGWPQTPLDLPSNWLAGSAA